MLSESTPAAEAATEDFVAIEKAVMESRRGRWFLDEYVRRREGSETKTLLTAIGKLETAVAASQDVIVERLSKALGLMTSLDAKLSSTPSVATPPVQLAPQHMKFFKQDEELFEAPAKPAEIRKVQELKPETAKGAKLVIRQSHAEGRSTIVATEKELSSPLAPPTETPSRNRIVIIRHKTDETPEVPLHDELRASA